MEIEEIKQFIRNNSADYSIRIRWAHIAQRYYESNTAILNGPRKTDEDDNPMHNADNRIPGGFHRLLVKQKAAYLMTYAPLLDIGSSMANKALMKALGAKFTRVCKQLVVSAANAGTAWIHYWDEDGIFKYGVIKDSQLMPIFSDDLEDELIGMVRRYTQTITEEGYTGTEREIFEVWNDTTCEMFSRPCNLKTDDLYPYDGFVDVDGNPTSTYEHNLGRVPFIRFKNNGEAKSDLTETLKGLIDSYDKTLCGFVNDLEDIQEIIFILKGYEGEDKNGLLQDIKQYKTILLDADKDSNAGVETLKIDIPVEAREKLLEITRKAIFEQGQGMDPLQESFGDKSGEALKYMYALLELKAGDTETEFRPGFEELVKVVCEHEGLKFDGVIQTWTRNSIRNDKEQADICRNSTGIISNRTIIANHPFVENLEAELQYMKEERKAEQEDLDILD